ncbi:hypothetical protein AQPE_1509 [Aquipluma nitroreducens]|uniref:Uncharacterized protein n=1 Tax=Aquipluma nitroreducens TaxID=2010828 RepID=A0A5K7S7E2_9BACT|nr:hypothetical protein AQPE_1509 [Aquipluma nitroreducens]
MRVVVKGLRYDENNTKYKTKTPENLLFRRLSGVFLFETCHPEFISGSVVNML